MGLVVHDEPMKVIGAEGREWGPPAHGLALSIQALHASDPEQLPEITAVIVNRSDGPQTLTVPGWLFYFDYEVESSPGVRVELSGFGRQLLRPERKTERLEIVLTAGGHAATEIPIGSLFGLRARTPYSIRLRAGELESNLVRVGQS